MRIDLVALICLSCLSVGCAERGHEQEAQSDLTGIRYLGGPTETGFARVLGPREFAFPRDHGPHPRFRNEWWYFTGNVLTEDGRHFGYELTFFRVGIRAPRGSEAAPPELATAAAAQAGTTSSRAGVGYDPAAAPGSSTAATAGSSAALDRWTTNSVWMAHFAVTDTTGRRFHAEERLSRGHPALAYARSTPLTLRVEDWYAQELQDSNARAPTLRLVAESADAAIDLVVSGLDDIVLQGDRGYDRKGPEEGNASHYYSAPRLVTTGRVRVGDDDLQVRGSSWLDREWSTSALSAGMAGWDWFALQLSDGTDVMYYRLRHTDGSTSEFSGGTIVDKDRNVLPLGPEDVRVEALDVWRSPETGVRYPLDWRFTLEKELLELEISPYLENQELALSVRYWEGAVRITGERAGEAVTGNGYVELAGY